MDGLPAALRKHPVSTYTPTPQDYELLAQIARKQIRQSLRAARDAASVLMDASGDTADHDRAVQFFVEIGHLAAKADQQLKDR